MTRPARTVYRIERSQGCGLAIVLGGGALVAAVMLRIQAAATFWGIVAAAAAFGFIVGHTLKKRKCSHCREPLHGDAEKCPGCGGIIKGNVRSAREAYAAEQTEEDDG
jgi:hypothetical protein